MMKKQLLEGCILSGLVLGAWGASELPEIPAVKAWRGKTVKNEL